MKRVNDHIGFDPTRNQSEYGTPRHSSYGNELNSTSPKGAIDFFPTFPYRHDFNFAGAQMFADPVTDTLYNDSFGYRGVAPLGLQPIYDLPEPWSSDKYK